MPLESGLRVECRMAKLKRSPNVVVFFTDQQRWDTTGLHGNPDSPTPNFDALARRGTDVHRSFTCQPVCGPARSCLQTGLYATQTGVFRNGIGIEPGTVNLGARYREAGYQTGYIGKWHLAADAVGAVPAATRQGYDYWLGSNLLEFTSLPYDTTLYDINGEPVQLPGYRIDALTDVAIRKITDWKDNPFFLMISYLEPHQQNQWDNFPAPLGYEKAFSTAAIPADLRSLQSTARSHYPGYIGMVKRLDEALGRILEALISLDLMEDTILLYTSDHGCHFKSRNAEYKRSAHESSIRVPTAFSGPGFNGGGRIEQLVSLVDIPPTLLDACNIEVPEEMEGRSILPLLRGESEDWPSTVFFQISEDVVGRGIRTHRWKYAVTAPDTDPFDASAAENYEETVLYDLKSDPHELVNLVDLPSHDDLRRELRRSLRSCIRRIEGYEPEIRPSQSDGASSSENIQMWGVGQRRVFPSEMPD